MSRAVIDASIVVKVVVDQPLTANARTAINSFELSAPFLLMAETANALLKYVRAGLMPPEAATMALQTIGRHAIDLHPIDDASTRDAFDLALHRSHSISDCYYLALARRLKAPFITADLNLLRKALADGMPVINLAEISESLP